MDIAELEQRVALLSEALETIQTIDQRSGGLTASSGRPASGHAARMAARSGRAKPSPEQQAARTGGAAPVALVAAASAPGLNPGDTLQDRDALARVTADVLQGLDRYGAPSGDHQLRGGAIGHTTARARWSHLYPVERRLGNNAAANSERVGAVCAPQAVLASGGVCLPVNVDYSVPTWATSDRPLRDGLPPFQADRGGLRFVTPPDIGVPSLQATASGLGSATGIWTEATDASPAGATKPVYQVACGSEQLAYVNAIPTRVGFGNMQGRFAPEQVAANTDLAIAVAAREAELELLTLMYNSSKQVIPQQYLGAFRDLLTSADLLVEQYRYSHRIPETVNFTAVLPAWAKGLLRADIAREIAHDNAGAVNVLSISDEQIEADLAARGITNVIWTLDGLKAATYGTGGSALSNQFFGLLGTNAPEPQWPNQSSDGTIQLGWLLYPEGTYQFLDGGRLDLGVVRDSTLDATNDYESFVETFEGVAFRGLESYQIQSTLKPTGGSAGTVAATSYHE